MVTVIYLKAVHSPRGITGNPGDIRELDEVFARKLIADGYVQEAVIAVEPTVHPEPKPEPTPQPVTKKTRKKRRSRAKRTKTGDER